MLLEIRNLSFSHLADRALFEDFSLQMNAGQIVALAGESGCGKSTLLNLIYGLLDAQKGEIHFEGQPILGPKNNLVPGEANMKLVAQHYDLMPYATVAENVGKFISNINLTNKKQRIQDLLHVVGLEEYAGTLPKYLSGGQQQRVAIARALSVLPKLLLLDEPFSNLDYSRKMDLRERLFRYATENNIALLISTHEIQDVLPWLDQIVVLKEGELVQNDSPRKTYCAPRSAYVARLFGEVNILTALETIDWNLSKEYWYPHEIKISERGFPAEVIESRFAGSHYWTKLKLSNRTMVAYTDNKFSGLVNITFGAG